MKKILFGILTFLGIGLSFCSADGIYHNPDLGLISIVVNGETVYTLQDKNLGATCYDVNQSCSYGNYYQWGNIYSFGTGSYTQNSNDGNCKNSSQYGPGNYFNSNGFACDSWKVSVNMWGGVTNTDEARQGPCDSGYNLIYTWSSFSDSLSSYFTVDKSFFRDYLFFSYGGYRAAFGFGLEQVGNFTYYQQAYLSSDTYYGEICMQIGGGVFKISTSNYSQVGASVRCFKNSVVDPDYTWLVLTGDIIEAPANPKLKINYGNSFTEYDLEDNLSIYLKSPVVQNGTTFTYAGSTGINLFYNGSSQFYSKDKLYLNTPSWYNNNVFTPICL